MWQAGWWTTGRDRAALDLFRAVRSAMADGTIPGAFGYLFCSREAGESAPSDAVIREAEAAGVPVVTCSAARFRPELRAADREAWRTAYHREVLARLSGFTADLVVLAGYMWVVSAEVCRSLPVINLHPAAPGGPAGTWQEVIWQLLEAGAAETGVMMHLVTPELDQGPPVTFCRFPITGGAWDALWTAYRDKRRSADLSEIQASQGEAEPLFAAVRREGVRRELPLIVQTLRAFAAGEVALAGGRLVDAAGRPLDGPRDLTGPIEEMLAGGAG
ncbi:formyl transferase [Dissulfurirhabdus thermomarina]|uniref:phosphoribosylglycinamide formyltransferase 1 n=1 Tax=Dissulfurirhabdus thermomarina TaxID=1765737 RepID=A0A6N9TM78_DISTH|nr:formyltransferase family protein [Dissulfurirhabdus thermomarina]NDY42345.1 formyl transferase [Dissulfurirhabdus thermomarina]NMX24219.1 formyl transferase [Dissulfurirhabdus thermomarina]